MYKKLLTILIIFFSTVSIAQQGVYSPYSFFGIGSPAFKGTAENRSMGGISILTDSIHLNLQNPAAYADLRLTTFTAGLTVNNTTYESDNLPNEQFRNTTVDYFSFGIPTKIGGFGGGLKPFSAVGYRLDERDETKINVFLGRGGVNTVYLSYGKQLFDKFKIGASVNYNFGESENKALLFMNDVEFASRDINTINYGGIHFNLSAMYETIVNDKYTLGFLGMYRPNATLSAEVNRRVATVIVDSSGNEIVQDEQNFPLSTVDLSIPEQYTFGVSYGKSLKWQIGLEYQQTAASNFDLLAFNSSADLVYTDARMIRLGGYFVPRYDDPTNAFKRWSYRAGIRYQETGMQINNQDIRDYGMSFGVGIPSGRYFTNANLGVEYGFRGTTSAGLVRENYISVFLSFSFNDRWFVEKKYN